ncbi:hypothetical protein BKE38_01895 [Pseudoroseomonas deserti]|uniref:Response regulatory domain-containing protein n=1 Tax=Teichococcus deserti TaxID=1817963 RepID=A0A1V2H869_9PROT|nr:response regulator [Pseudoroseomonas deserti]ONG58808.1 hypothetical protein BKE38_01895 [Pseudoroseomonas deserti]
MCILVVEDEALIRFVIIEVFGSAGFEVCEACCGEQAAALIDAADRRFSLLITDIHMPGKLDGIAVAGLMRLRYPGTPILFTTGRPDVLDGPEGLKTGDRLLQKPYGPTRLLTVAREMLDGKLPLYL